MLISKNWLQKYIDIPQDITPDIILRQISRCVAEVEGYKINGENLENIVVGKILKITEHPNANLLKLCQVAISKNKKVQVVCGGSNLQKNMYVAFANIGAKIKWHGDGDFIKLEKAIIRGEESNGMICASNEIGLSDKYKCEGKEILDLEKIGLQNLQVGQELKEALGLTDTIFEIENKTLSNRPDLWGHYGMAREFSAVFGLPLKSDGVEDIPFGSDPFKVSIQNYEDCKRFCGVKLSGIKIEESPSWLKLALESVGVRPINNVVDITNYIMLDLGQPLHAFDLDKFTQEALIVRRAKKNEQIELLNGKKIKLDESVLVVADTKHPLALAGIMGGSLAEVTNETQNIFLECANFNSSLIRKTSSSLGIRTDASMRFEKSLDPHNVSKVLRKAVNMILDIIPTAKVSSVIIDEFEILPQQIELTLSLDKVNKILGEPLINKQFIQEKLTALGFNLEFKEEWNNFIVKIPTWRCTKDVTIVEDICEEILRMYGYDLVVAKEPICVLNVPRKNNHNDILFYVKNFCVMSLGMNEVFTYSFVSENSILKLGNDISKNFILENPIAKDTPFIRASLLENLFEAVSKNTRFYDHFALFEIGRVFINESGEFDSDPFSKELLPKQPYRLSGVFVPKNNETPFYDAKSALVKLFNFLHIPIKLIPNLKTNLANWMHPKRTVEIEVLNEKIGVISELHPNIAKNFGIKKRVGVFDLDFDVIVKLASIHSKYKPFSKYPSINLDVSMIVDKQILWQEIKEVIIEANKDLVVDIKLFDIFENDELRDKNKKSLAFRIIYQSNNKTLEQDEVNIAHDGILKELNKVFNCEFRIS